jgi:hypothetical protein
MSTQKYRISHSAQIRESKRIGQAKSRAKFRAEVQQIKKSKGCALCSEKHPACLQFHHRDPTTKKEKVSSLISKGRRSALMKEIEKCEILCANCHAKLHWGRRGSLGRQKTVQTSTIFEGKAE